MELKEEKKREKEKKKEEKKNQSQNISINGRESDTDEIAKSDHLHTYIKTLGEGF